MLSPLIVALSVHVGFAAATPATPEPPPQAAVLPLVSKGVSPDIASVCDDLLTSAVMQSGRYRTIAKSDIDALLRLDQMKDNLGCTELACATEIGGALGVPFLITGSVAKLVAASHDSGGDRLVLTLKLLDVGNAKAVNQISHASTYDESRLDTEMVVAVGKLLGTLPPVATTPVVAGIAPALLPAAGPPAAGFDGRTQGGATVVAVSPALIIRAVGVASEGEPGSGKRLNFATRRARGLASDLAMATLKAPPFNLTVAAAATQIEAAMGNAKYARDGDFVELVLTIAP